MHNNLQSIACLLHTNCTSDKLYLEVKKKGCIKLYYIIITHSVYADKELNDGAKLLYGLILSLSQKDGYCYAENEYLCDTLGKSRRMINYYLEALAQKKYIYVDFLKKTTRRITTQDTRVRLKPQVKNIDKVKHAYKQDVQRPEWLTDDYLKDLAKMDN